ncbi:MAG: hypothetical protein JNL83_13595 [Myxococcales bacterium]|nr:hypothetical protein [Myxococcales bacterium]
MKVVIAALSSLAVACTSSADMVCEVDAEVGWRRLPSYGAVRATSEFASVWTGSELLLWGGNATSPSPVGTGGRYDPRSNRWRAIATEGAPSARENASVVWTGSEMIVWGGDDGLRDLDDGARYDPVLDRWTPVSQVNAPGKRHDALTVWTGSEVLIVGGDLGLDLANYSLRLSDGALYNPTTDTWRAVEYSGASPVSRRVRAAWAGREVFFWGPSDPGVPETYKGRAYDPTTGNWRLITTENAPPNHQPAVMTELDGKLLVWGTDGPYYERSTGALYDLTTDTWTRLPVLPLSAAGAILAGDRLVVASNDGHDGWLVDPIDGTYSPIPELTTDWVPITWTGSETIAWNRFSDAAGPTAARLVACDEP